MQGQGRSTLLASSNCSKSFSGAIHWELSFSHKVKVAIHKHEELTGGPDTLGAVGIDDAPRPLNFAIAQAVVVDVKYNQRACAISPRENCALNPPRDNDIIDNVHSSILRDQRERDQDGRATSAPLSMRVEYKVAPATNI